MAYLSSCSICDVSVLNDDLCLDCKDEIAQIAIRHEHIDMNCVKNRVEAKRIAQIQKELDRERTRLNKTCPTCGQVLV